MYINEHSCCAKFDPWFIGVGLLTVLACGSSSSGGAGSVADGGGVPIAQPGVTIADLAAAGLPVFADPSQAQAMVAVTTVVEPTPLRLLREQADAMSREALAGQGMLGSDLDNLVVTADGLPPASYFLAGYVSAAGTPGADLARNIMGVQDWRNAPSVVYPSLVFVLYAADAARYADALAGFPTAVSKAQVGVPGRLPRIRTMDPQGPCSLVQGFINTTISDFFTALGHLQSPQVATGGGGVLGWFGTGLQAAFDLATGVVNGLIDASQFIVNGIVKAAAQPLLDVIAKVAGALAVGSEIVLVLRPWTVVVTADPMQTQKAVGPEPGWPGAITATVTLPGGIDKWPDTLADCAQAAGVPLPPLKPIGAPVVWTITQSPGDLVVQDPGLPTVLDDKATARLTYVTTSETERAARGDAFEGRVKADIAIRRQEIADLQKTVSDEFFSLIPSLIVPILKPILNPVVQSLLNLPAGLLDTHGYYRSVVVTYHECQSGDCCPVGKSECGPVCVDLLTDPMNCGACANVCPSGQSCQGGVCVPPPDPVACGGPCPSGQQCLNGNCTTPVTLGSCTLDSRFCEDYTGVSWTAAVMTLRCGAGTVSPSPCPTAGRLGSCLVLVLGSPADYSYELRFYPGLPTTFCNACTGETDCTDDTSAPSGPDNPTHPCANGCCDLRYTVDDATKDCRALTTQGSLNWTPN